MNHSKCRGKVRLKENGQAVKVSLSALEATKNSQSQIMGMKCWAVRIEQADRNGGKCKWQLMKLFIKKKSVLVYAQLLIFQDLNNVNVLQKNSKATLYDRGGRQANRQNNSDVE